MHGRERAGKGYAGSRARKAAQGLCCRKRDIVEWRVRGRPAGITSGWAGAPARVRAAASWPEAAGRRMDKPPKGACRGSWTDRMAAKRTPAEFGVPCAMSEYVSGRLGKRRKRVRAAPAGHHGMQFPVTGPGTTSACRGARRSISPVSRPCRMTAACVRRTSGQTTLSRRCPPRWAIRNPQHPVIV